MRNFEIQIEVFPCPYKDEPKVSDQLVAWGIEIDSDIETYDPDRGDGQSYWGLVQLVDDQTEEQRHEELRGLMPDRSITTRWRYVDDQVWDDVIETEPLKPRK
jgi:hypothetical protein